MLFFTRYPHLTVLGLLAALTLLLVFCLRPATTDARVVIRYAYWGAPEQQAIANEIVRAFEASHPGIRIQCEFVGLSRDYWRRLKTQIPAGVAPDVWFLEPNPIPDFACRGGAGVLLPLDDLVQADPELRDQKRFYAPVVEAFRWKGRLYALPTQFSTMAIFYNKQLFDQFKIPYPDPDWDWNGFLDVARKLTRDLDGDQETDVWGFSGGGIHPERGYGNFIWSNGGRFISDDRTKIVLADETPLAGGGSNRERVSAALDFAVGLMHREKVMPPLGSGYLANQTQMQSFTSGKLGLTLGATFLCNLFNSDPACRGSYDVVPFPKGPRGERGSAFICRGNGLNARLKNDQRKRDAAWAFVKFCASRPAQEILARSLQDLPVLREVAEDPQGAFLGSPSPPAHKAYFLVPAREEHVHDIFAVRGSQEWWDKALRPELATIYRREQPIERGLRTIQREGNRIIDEAEHPPEYERGALAFFPPLAVIAACAAFILLSARRARAERRAAAALGLGGTDRPRLWPTLRALGFILPNFLGFLLFILLPVVASLALAFCEWDLLSPPRFAGVKNFDLLLTQGDGESFGWLAGAARTWLAVNLLPALAATLAGAAALLASLALGARLGRARVLARFWPLPLLALLIFSGARADLPRTFFVFHTGAEEATLDWARLAEGSAQTVAARAGLEAGPRAKLAAELARRLQVAVPRDGDWAAPPPDLAAGALAKLGLVADAADALQAALEAEWRARLAPWAARLRAETERVAGALAPGSPAPARAEFAGRLLAALTGAAAADGRPEEKEAAAGRLAGELGLLPPAAGDRERRRFAQALWGRTSGRILGPLPVALGWTDALLAALLVVQLLLLAAPRVETARAAAGAPGARRTGLDAALAALGRAPKWLLALAALFLLGEFLRLPSLLSVMRLPGDQQFWYFFYNTLFLLLALPLHMLLSLGLALLVNRKLRGIYAYRVLYFLPSITAGVALYVVWDWLYNREGLFNLLIAGAGRVLDALAAPFGGHVGPWHGTSWLDSVFWAKPALMLMDLWITAGGFHMVLYLAGLQGIDPQLYEAARIDGAGRWGQFRHVTWPLLSPTSFFILVMGTIHGLEGGFDRAFVMTDGGPGFSTTTLSYYIFNNAYQWFNMGYAAAIAWVLFFLVFCVTLFNWRYAGRRVEY